MNPNNSTRTLISQLTNSATTNSKPPTTTIRCNEQRQDRHMHTLLLTSAPQAPANHQLQQHQHLLPQPSSGTSLRTTNQFAKPARAASNRYAASNLLQLQSSSSSSGAPQQAPLKHPRQLTRATTTSNSTQLQKLDETQTGARRRGLTGGFGVSSMISSIALVGAALALIALAGGGGGRGGVQVVEGKPVTNQQQQQQQQYQLVQFRRLPPKEFSAALGSSIIIECEAGAAPPPAIHWLRNGARIHQNDLDDNQLDSSSSSSQQESLASNSEQISLSSTRSRLFIDCASLADEATYTCVAENAFSRVSTHTTLKIIRPVQVAAVAEADLFAADNELGSELAVERSDDIELAAGPGPVPKRGVTLDLEAAEKSLSAVPQCLPNLHTSTTQAPLRIHMWTHNILERMKNSVLLYCRSNAAKPTTTSQQSQEQQNNMNDDNSSKKTLVTWTLPNDKQVEANQSDKYEILSSGDLLIKDLRWSDMGSYICTVSNDQSSDSVSSFVYPSKRTWLVT